MPGLLVNTTAARPFEVRHVQLARAAFAAIAAIMVTFSPDHSAAVGLSVFSGFAIATGLIFLLAAWLVHPAGLRWPSILLGILSIIAGMIGGIVTIRSVTLFFAVVIAWAFTTGIVETIAGARALRQAQRPGGAAQRPDGAAQRPGDAALRPDGARDALTTGILTLVLGGALLLVPTQYALQYSIDGVDDTFTLTGIIIGVGIFGGYAAIIAVYLAIAGFSPRKPVPSSGRSPESARGDSRRATAEAPRDVAAGEGSAP